MKVGRLEKVLPVFLGLEPFAYANISPSETK